MEKAKLILEYIRVILTTPVLLSVVAIVFIFKFNEDIKALLLRIAKIKLPGGTEVSTPQSNQLKEDTKKPHPEPTEDKIQGLPQNLTTEQRQAIEQLVRAHIANAYLWEYRYLNFYLVRSTQVVLDWLIGLPQSTTYAHYDSFWLPLITAATERQAIINALESHHLITLDASNMITVTPKGKEYQEWRGALPPLPSGAT